MMMRKTLMMKTPLTGGVLQACDSELREYNLCIKIKLEVVLCVQSFRAYPLTLLVVWVVRSKDHNRSRLFF